VVWDRENDVGEQLDLFGNRTGPVVVAKPAMSEAEPEPVASAPIVLPGQMDLFGERWLRAGAAHKALESFDLEGASEALTEAVRLYPADNELRERATLVGKLAGALRDARDRHKSAAEALSAIAGEVPAFLMGMWHRHVAELMEREGGSGSVLHGIPAGFHWLHAGDAALAEQSLRATLATLDDDREACCRARAYLGDALIVLGRRNEALLEYREAIANCPTAVDWPKILDVSVRDLPAIAELDYEVPSNPADWAAAIGLIDGVFIPPSIMPEDWLEASVLDGLSAGQRFYRWMVAESAARENSDRIACRRSMKALSSRLLLEILARR